MELPAGEQSGAIQLTSFIQAVHDCLQALHVHITSSGLT